MGNWRMIGHTEIITLLKEQIRRGTAPQAYLITGVEGVGRHTLALRLSQALNCPQPIAPAEPCSVCQTCMQIEHMQHPDLYVVRAEQGSRQILVDQVRALQHWLSLTPYVGPMRIALLLCFEDANPSAANALLKTLEEPPPRAILILTAESEELLLPTIVSRCEVMRLQPQPIATVSLGLQQLYGIPAEEAELLAHLSGGRPGYALWLHQHPEQQEQRQTRLEEFMRLLYSNRFERFVFAAQISSNKEDLTNVLKLWISFWRDVLLSIAKTPSEPINIDFREQIEQLVAQLDLHTAQSFLNALGRTLNNLMTSNINPRLACEVMFLDMPYLPLRP